MPLIEIYHRDTEGWKWTRYQQSSNGFEHSWTVTGDLNDPLETGYYLLAGSPYPFAGPFASLDAAKERLDIEMRYRDAVEQYERARDAARDALFEVAAVIADAVCGKAIHSGDVASSIRYDWETYCDDPTLLPMVPETASDYIDDPGGARPLANAKRSGDAQD